MSLYIENYGDKLCLIKGNSYMYREKLKELGCKFNPDLKSWYFPKINLDKIQNYIDSINTDDDSDKSKNDKKITKITKMDNIKDIITKKDFLSLLSRVERIEQILELQKNNHGTIFEVKKQQDNIVLPIEEKNKDKEEDNAPQRLLRRNNMNVIYVDGCCNKETKDVAWGSVVNENKIDLVSKYKHLYTDLIYEQKKCKVGDRIVIIAKATDVESQQNNYAELLAFVFALRLTKINNIKEIKTDSELIYKYWSKPDHNTKLTEDENKNKYIKESKVLREEFEKKGGIITKIPGGENKADLGYHKE